MQIKRIQPGQYRGTSADFTVEIERDQYGKWFWTVNASRGGTKSGIRYSLTAAKAAAADAVARMCVSE